MSYSYYQIEKKGPVAWVFMNRPEKKNAMNPPAWTELIPIMNDIDNDDQIRVAIIAARGSIFCAGIDLVEMIPTLPELMEKEQKGGVKQKLIKKILNMQEGLSCIENCRKPVIAAVHGKCIGAGLDLISACDIRLCTEDAEFSLREAAIAIVADMGVLQRLPQIVGQGITREMAFTARYMDSKKARSSNLVNEVYPDYDSLLKGAEEMAMMIASNSPIAVKAVKDVLNFGIGKSIRDGLVYNAAVSADIIPSNDLMEAFTAFAQKRKPDFSGT